MASLPSFPLSTCQTLAMLKKFRAAHISTYLILVARVVSEIDYYFPSNDTCTLRNPKVFHCDFQSEKVPCAYNTFVSKGYCCPPNADYCWSWSDPCSGVNSTPGDGQITCEGGYCCLLGSETCSEIKGQTNICWLPNSPFVNTSSVDFNATYSSLLSASPDASTLPLMQATTSEADTFDSAGRTTQVKTVDAPSSPSATTMANTSTPAATTSVPVNTLSTHEATTATLAAGGLSAGAIAGVVVGTIISAFMLVLGAFLFGKRRERIADQRTSNKQDRQAARQAFPRKSKYATCGYMSTTGSIHELASRGNSVRKELANGLESHEMPTSSGNHR
ncbi:hypothetical protein FH972_026455 [Carpinus fangiana]|uniref:Uncharacterized protein n=1 Tax=Carpinus fangiana TaxID=176857 RepID=A0A5N6L451_9ROSI|nr:hypothetical protein FH972_026455 [Carpinus fangiana]